MRECIELEKKPFVLKDELKRGTNSSILIVGGRRQGKTVLISQILREICPIERTKIILVFTKSPKTAEYYKNLGVTAVFMGYQQEIIDATLHEFPDISKVILFDDCIDRSETKNAAGIAELFTNGRHSNFTIIFSTQDIKAANVTWRKNIDLLFIFPLILGDDREYMTSGFLYGLPDFSNEFGDAYKKTIVNRYIANIPKYHFVLVNYVGEVKTVLSKAEISKKKLPIHRPRLSDEQKQLLHISSPHPSSSEP